MLWKKVIQVHISWRRLICRKPGSTYRKLTVSNPPFSYHPWLLRRSCILLQLFREEICTAHTRSSKANWYRRIYKNLKTWPTSFIPCDYLCVFMRPFSHNIPFSKYSCPLLIKGLHHSLSSFLPLSSIIGQFCLFAAYRYSFLSMFSWKRRRLY